MDLVGVLLFNHSENDFKVGYGDRIAQLIIEQIKYTNLQEVTELADTQRGTGGFGSTGITHNINQSHDHTNNPLLSQPLPGKY